MSQLKLIERLHFPFPNTDAHLFIEPYGDGLQVVYRETLRYTPLLKESNGTFPSITNNVVEIDKERFDLWKKVSSQHS